jgi:hypothetical protein
MSNWRDRTERDAMIRNHDKYNYEKEFSSPKKESANISFSRFLFAAGPFLLSVMLFYISISSIVNNNNLVINVPSNKSKIKVGRAICEVDSSGEFSILVVDSNGGVKKMLKFNSAYFSSSGYTPAKRCSQIASRVNAAIMSGKEGYITANLIEGKGVLCISKNSQDICTKDDVIATISSSSRNNINGIDSDYILLETCLAYSKPSKLANKAEKTENEEANICSFPLNKSLAFLE